MKGKILFVVGLGVGYVLGTRAGRERYDQIKRAAEGVWNQPAVQQGVDTVKDFAKARVAICPAPCSTPPSRSSATRRRRPGHPAKMSRRPPSPRATPSRRGAKAAKDVVDTTAEKLDEAIEKAADAASDAAEASGS